MNKNKLFRSLFGSSTLGHFVIRVTSSLATRGFDYKATPFLEDDFHKIQDYILKSANRLKRHAKNYAQNKKVCQ